MRKIKLFMMLALLVAGVSGAWGYSYTVSYSGRTANQGAGYTKNSEYITSANNATTLVTSNNYVLQPEDITPKPIVGYETSVTVTNTNNNRRVTITYTLRYVSYRVLYEKAVISGTGYTVNNNAKAFVTTGDDSDVITFDISQGGPSSVTSTTIGNYITARTVSGHTNGFYVNEAEAELGYKGNIYINYSTTSTGKTWDDGVFKYSTIYQRETYTKVELPEGEVAISLYMGDSEEVTDTVSYTSQHGTGWRTDDDGDDVGTQAYFTSLGRQYNGISGQYEYFYTRRHQVACSKQTSVTIPATVTYEGKTYDVTAIQKWGFGYNQTHDMKIYSCNNDHIWGCIDDHSNRYLQTVRFENPSNMKSIGDYAFMSCTQLTSIVFPNSLEYLGQGIFEMCYRLNDCRFQTLDDGTVKFKILKMFTFWLCTGLKSLELPDGIIEIEGQQAGAALQYMLSLTNIRLPNTLQHIGPHFLCCASALKTLTIPASVTYIDGAAFHGCASLENVYLLGSAAALQAEYTGSGSGASSSSTFSENSTFCKDEVSECTFWVTDDYYDSYADDPVWSKIDETVFNADFTEVISQSGNKNALRKIIKEKRVFPAKWVTAIFPYGVKNYKEAFPKGSASKDTRVAVMDPDATHTVTTGTDPSGKSVRLYNVVYKLIDGDDIPAQTPVLICAAQETEYVMFTTEQAATDWFKDQAPREHPTTVTAEDDATITMKGKYIPYTMHPWDFYFMYKDKVVNADGSITYPDEPAKFYRVPSADKAATVGTCRCYWTINVENVKVDTNMAPAQNAKGYNIFMDEDDVTGIDDVEVRVVIEGIYDLNGRKLDIAPEELPKGVYIVNGKKQMVK